MMSNLNYYNKHRGNNKKKVLALIVVLIVFGLSLFIISEYIRQPTSKSVEEKSITKSTGVVIGNSSDNIVENSNKSIEAVTSIQINKASLPSSYGLNTWITAYGNTQHTSFSSLKGSINSPRFEKYNPAYNEQAGIPILDDLNGDGSNEIAVPIGDTLHVYDKNLNEIWKFQALNKLWSMSPAVGKNKDGSKFVAITSMDGFVYVLNGKDGLLIWKFEEKKTNGAASPLVYDLNNDGTDDVIVTGYPQNTVTYALNGVDGSVLWKIEMGSDIGQPAIADLFNDGKKEVVIIGNSIENKIAIVGTGGNIIKQIPIGGMNGAMNVISIADVNGDGLNEFIVGSYDNYIYVYDINGKLLWKATTGGEVWSPASVADINSDGKPEIVVKSRSNKVFAFSGDTGNMLWFSDSKNNKIILQ